jgi:hypothetical protein
VIFYSHFHDLILSRHRGVRSLKQFRCCLGKFILSRVTGRPLFNDFYDSSTLSPPYIASTVESKGRIARHGRRALRSLESSPVLPEAHPSRSHINTRSPQWRKAFAGAGEFLTCAGASTRWLTHSRVSGLVILELEALTPSSPHSRQDRRILSNTNNLFFPVIFQHTSLRFRDRMELRRAGLPTSRTSISRTSQYRRISSALKHR